MAPMDPKAEEVLFTARRNAMVAEIEAETLSIVEYRGRRAPSARVLKAMRQVPRHEFVRDSEKDLAYRNVALSIGHGQTISQPYIVALMTNLLGLTEDSIVLEVGTGSGYQAAVLAALVRRVYSIERILTMAEEAKARFQHLGISNIEVRVGDGYYGWPEHAPYDGILVTASAPSVPSPLIAQLRPGARMVIPLGRPFEHQNLTVAQKDRSGHVHFRAVLPVAFVPFEHEPSIEHGEEL